MADISIDVSNVNNTAVIHSGNTSTSNMKNLISSVNHKKGFMKNFPINQDPTIKKPDS